VRSDRTTGWVWVVEEAMPQSLKYIPPVLCPAHTVYYPGSFSLFLDKICVSRSMTHQLY
jgi:hypothetical protein